MITDSDKPAYGEAGRQDETEVRRGVRYPCGSYMDLVTAIEPDSGWPSGFRVDYQIERPDGTVGGHGSSDLDAFRESRTRARVCPTRCDDDCEATCHEGHSVLAKKDHPDEWCQLSIEQRRIINDLTRALHDLGPTRNFGTLTSGANGG